MTDKKHNKNAEAEKAPLDDAKKKLDTASSIEIESAEVSDSDQSKKEPVGEVIAKGEGQERVSEQSEKNENASASSDLSSLSDSTDTSNDTATNESSTSYVNPAALGAAVLSSAQSIDGEKKQKLPDTQGKVELDLGRNDHNKSEAKITDAQKNDDDSSSRVTSASQQPSRKKKRNIGLWLSLILFILLCAIAAYGVYFIFDYFKKDNQRLTEKIALLEESLSQTTDDVTPRFDRLAEIDSQLKAQDQTIQKTLQEVARKVQTAEQRLASQRKRILSMSTTSREDWLLAEAEYLLKLASQRILVERNAQGAKSLLVEADSILKDIGDPDLFAIRKQLASDIAAVQLTEKIDIEGLYLRMQALIESIDSIPANPNWDQRGELLKDNQINIAVESDSEQVKGSEEKSDHWFEKTRVKFLAFTGKFDSYIRIRKHNESTSERLLIPTPEQEIYHKQNLQLIIERANLALLREQQVVYQSSLEQAQRWLLVKFPESAQQQMFIRELETIKQINVTQTLPDITQSLEALKEYILKLHALENTAASKGGES